MSKTAAKEKDRKYRTEVLEGKHRLKAKRIKFEKFSEKYLEYARTNKKPKSARRNESSINMLMPHFKGKLIQSIHPLMVEKFKKDRKDNGVNIATINRDIATLRNMLNKAIEWKYLSSNPMEGVKAYKEDNEKTWALTEEEETKLLEECEKSTNECLTDLVLFALNSGMRADEILSQKKVNVKLKERHILVKDTKNHEPRKVPVNDTLLSIIERLLENEKSDFVFCNEDGERFREVPKAFWKAVKDAGLIRDDGDKKERFRFHDLRHTFGTRLGMRCYDLKSIMEVMGIKTPKVAMRYQHPTWEHKLNMVKSLDEPSPKSTPEKITPLKSVENSMG